MKKIKYITILLFSLLFLTTCKKYPEGGWVALTIKHLFGHNKDGAQKIWKLKTYEVNGIDSTDLLIQNQYFMNYKESFCIFKIEDVKLDIYRVTTKLYRHQLEINKNSKTLFFSSELNNPIFSNDTSQCFVKESTLLCERNIFNPEFNRACTWKINKLTKHKLIIESSSINNYKIMLEY